MCLCLDISVKGFNLTVNLILPVKPQWLPGEKQMGAEGSQ